MRDGLWLRINGFLPVQDDQLSTIPMGPLEVEPVRPAAPGEPQLVLEKTDERPSKISFMGMFFL